jgi:AcrR family transcriptional regulator
VPRAGLTSESVVASAADLADEVGWDRLTLAALAGRVGVAIPSLYKHVDGLPGLRRALTALVAGELAAVLSGAAVGRSGTDALRALAAAYRTYARAHGGRYPALVAAPDPADQIGQAAAARAVGVIVAVLRGYDVADADTVDAVRFLRSALHGFVTLETAGGFGLPDDVDHSFDRMVDGIDTALRHWSHRA